ncbi:uncharacterized protein LOC135480394 [Liolophura sinensis]|uniref:uncharacterized protein LOC135480394 n=1 Tax=Liolophura sinensis TaxID=3198878 RepID=UPI0031598D18
MANIYTKRSHYPRTTMANNYRPIITEGKLPKICRPQPRLLSPDRSLNPHPQGLSFQVPDGKAAFSIWNKDFEVIKQKLPLMLRYQRT